MVAASSVIARREGDEEKASSLSRTVSKKLPTTKWSKLARKSSSRKADSFEGARHPRDRGRARR